ncbi:MAG: type II toxin-antitoxin system RelE/ParE family toxin [Candidatus Tectomicrobia bacterium]|nr:type II toxin-antitoxin system RelE/ParE family toxin [Candidatus Tectomicrobia bacterium]
MRGERQDRTVGRMVIHSVRHRGLRHLLEKDNARFLSKDLVDRVRNILTVLILADHIDGFIAEAPPGWHVHRLSGNRRDEWNVSVSGNWRITFEESDGVISRLNLEDYH